MKMAVFRNTIIAWIAWTLLGLSGACTTSAVAVDQCREIENARCAASVNCGTVKADGVDQCQLLYRDQCLHGIAGPEAPTADQQQKCVNLIVEAGDTAQSSSGDEYDAACAVIGAPWNNQECQFLLPAMGGASGDGDGDGDGE
jgi:hypothetical protein